jgi:hypothetical protein
MGFEAVSWGFRWEMGLKQTHFFLVPFSSSGGNERLKVGRDLRRRKLIEPGLVTGVLELSFLDGHIDGKTDDAINQGGYDTHQRFHGRSAKRTDGGISEDGVVLLESAIGSFGCRSQAMQLAVTFRAPGDFEKQAGSLGNRCMGGKAKQFGSMGTIPVEIENGRVFGLHALLEAGKGQPLSGGIESIGTRGKVAV